MSEKESSKKFIGQLTGKELFDAEKRLSEYDGEDRMVSSHELAEELAKTEDSNFIVSTGIKSLDEMHEGGMEAGEVWIFSGPSGEGKTTITMSITQNMCDKDVKTAWFTLEVTPRQFIKKMQARKDTVPLFYLPNENQDPVIQWIEERIVEAKVKYNVQVVFIDHLQQIFSMARMENPSSNLSWEIGDLMAKIKSIAVMHDIAIALIAHTKDDPSGSSREPRKEDIRDSGLVQRLADTIVLVWRVPNSDELSNSRRKPLNAEDIKAKVRVAKNRRTGQVGAFFMYHQNHYLEESGAEYGNSGDDW